MPAFVSLLHLDTAELAYTAAIKRAGQFKTVSPGHRILRVRGHLKDSDPDDDRFGTYAGAKGWVEVNNLCSEITRKAEAILPPGIEGGLVFLEMIDPGAAVAQRGETAPYFERWTRAILPLRTSPATLLVYGTETASPGPGWLTVVSPRMPHCAVNMGEHPFIWLTLDFRKKETTC